MKPVDLFLREHAFVHTEAVARAESFNIDYLLDGMTEAQLRMRPHDMNSFAWLFWHMARVEDGFVSGIVMGRPQLLDEGKWGELLNVPGHDFGTGMSKSEVAGLSGRIDLKALWAYRDAVGRRTRSMVVDLWPDGWGTPIEADDLKQAASVGTITPDAATAMQQYLPGRSRESALFWWGLHHSLLHLGQITMLHGIVKAKGT